MPTEVLTRRSWTEILSEIVALLYDLAEEEEEDEEEEQRNISERRERRAVEERLSLCHTPTETRFGLLPFVAVEQTVLLNGYELRSGYGRVGVGGSPASAHILAIYGNNCFTNNSSDEKVGIHSQTIGLYVCGS